MIPLPPSQGAEQWKALWAWFRATYRISGDCVAFKVCLWAKNMDYENSVSHIKNGWKEMCKIHFKYQNKGI